MQLPAGKASTGLAYVAAVVLVNVGFSRHPELDWFWSLLVGGVLALRDVAQRRWGHRVLLLMLVGAALSFRLGAPAVALASATAFLISETVDWLVYTATHRACRYGGFPDNGRPVEPAVVQHRCGKQGAGRRADQPQPADQASDPFVIREASVPRGSAADAAAPPACCGSTPPSPD